MGSESGLIFFSDIVRFFLISLAAVLVGATVRIIQQYYRASRYAVHHGDFRGILPTHVWLIGISYVLLILGSVFHHFISLDTEPDAYLALNAAAYSTGAVALWLIMKFENRRVHAGRLEDRRKSDERRLADLTTSEFRVERDHQKRIVISTKDDRRHDDEPDA